MLVVLESNYVDVSRRAAAMVAHTIRTKPNCVLGLATGSTPLGMYQELVRLYKNDGLDFSAVTTFNLDEYLGLSDTHPQSFHHFMHANFFSQVNVRPQNIHIPDGTIHGGYDAYCAGYEKSIRDAGGIDLQVLGIGRNGHIGFNEPTSSFASRTRLKALTAETIEDNRKAFAPGEEIPKCAITMGIGTILDTKRVILLATGDSKAEAVASAIEGPITSSVSASSLQLHPDVTFILDNDATTELKQLDYYRRVLEQTAILTPEKLS